MSDRSSVDSFVDNPRGVPLNTALFRAASSGVAIFAVGAALAFISGCNAVTSRPSGAVTDSGWGAPPPVTVPQDEDAPLEPSDAEALVNRYAAGSYTGGQTPRPTDRLYEAAPSRDARPAVTGVIWDDDKPATRAGYRASDTSASRALGSARGAKRAAAGSSPGEVLPGGGVSIAKRGGAANVYSAAERDRAPDHRAAPDPAGGLSAGPVTSAAELFEALASLIENSNDDDLVKAVRLDALSLVDPAAGRELRTRSDPAAGLDADQQKIAALYRDVIKLIGDELAGDATASGPGALAELKARFEDLDVAGPLTVKRAELCRSVRGFGVYDPFESNTFVAGRTQPMIIYLELENFATKPISSTDHEVKLTQEVEIYNKSDGLVVWKNKPDQIVDRSRNRRRDFFTVQMIEVPARLTVGQFTIKVRVTDHHGNALDETNIPLNIVADRSLTSTRP